MLYPETVEGYVYAVNLPAYCEIASWRLPVYWGMFAGLTAAGVLKILTVKRGTTKGNRIITDISTGISIAALIFLVISRETYASALLVMMLTIKMILLLKYVKAGA